MYKCLHWLNWKVYDWICSHATYLGLIEFLTDSLMNSFMTPIKNFKSKIAHLKNALTKLSLIIILVIFLSWTYHLPFDQPREYLTDIFITTIMFRSLAKSRIISNFCLALVVRIDSRQILTSQVHFKSNKYRKIPFLSRPSGMLKWCSPKSLP